MRRKKGPFIITFLSPPILAALLACTAVNAPSQAENHLPKDELAYYSDSFDAIREDLWDRAGYLYRQQQQQSFKPADMRVVNGKLIVRTRTGGFSKGGIGSTYRLRGDFDIQLDCRMELIRGISGMDQFFSMAVFDASKDAADSSSVGISLSMKAGADRGYLVSAITVGGKRQRKSSKKMASFNGAFRIMRDGRNISTLYRQGTTAVWNLIDTFYATDSDMIIGVQLRNFFVHRTAIEAKQSISVELDNFKILAAQAIIEEEI